MVCSFYCKLNGFLYRAAGDRKICRCFLLVQERCECFGRKRPFIFGGHREEALCKGKHDLIHLFIVLVLQDTCDEYYLLPGEISAQAVAEHLCAFGIVPSVTEEEGIF